mmetsp:Transcript_36590/g.91109  ORF Transcript_36590/g.91109 Transcript_36590/m.91109 type:complete len:89 (+) Transcript_36590:101-367(+)
MTIIPSHASLAHQRAASPLCKTTSFVAGILITPMTELQVAPDLAKSANPFGRAWFLGKSTPPGRCTAGGPHANDFVRHVAERTKQSIS